MAKSKLTYRQFAELAISLARGEEIDNFDVEQFIEKAEALIAQQERKSEYSKANKKPSVSKVSQKTMDNAAAVLAVLTPELQTTAEINAAAGLSLEPLAVSNAIRYIERERTIVKGKKVEQTSRVKDGQTLTSDTLKTAYALGE